MSLNALQIAKVLDLIARTATEVSPTQINEKFRGIRLFLNVTAASGTTPTLDVKIQFKDPLSNTWIDLPGAAFAQKTAAGTDELVIYPGATVAANRSVSTVLPYEWRAVATIGGTTPSFTFSLGGSLQP